MPVDGTLEIGVDAAWSRVALLLHGMEYVSRRHATFWVDEARLYVRDEASTNGTHINGKPCTAGQPYELHAGDIVRMSGQLIVTVVEE